MVLNRCEWGRDDYSLEIKNLPVTHPARRSLPSVARQRTKEDCERFDEFV